MPFGIWGERGKCKNMKTIHAVYESGVFRPLETVELPERTEVEFEPRPVVQPEHRDGSLDSIYGVLEDQEPAHRSGEHDGAADLFADCFKEWTKASYSGFFVWPNSHNEHSGSHATGTVPWRGSRVGLLALWDESDQWHRAAEACFSELLDRRDADLARHKQLLPARCSNNWASSGNAQRRPMEFRVIEPWRVPSEN